jgi:hypothetical protein
VQIVRLERFNATSRSGFFFQDRRHAPDALAEIGAEMIGRFSVLIRRAAGAKGRIVLESANSGNKSWRASEASRHREVLHDNWQGAR